MTHAPRSPAQPRICDRGIAELVERRQQFLFFLRGLGHHAAAEDILQTAYLRLVERGVSLRDQQKLIGWFYRVLRNAGIDNVRAAQRMQRLQVHAISNREPETNGDEGQARLANATAMIGALEPGYREPLMGRYIEGLSLNELAMRSGITRNAATVRVHRALRALRALVTA
jgi:RNA polymerase sigma-70 factor, ECF subfamily